MPDGATLYSRGPRVSLLRLWLAGVLGGAEALLCLFDLASSVGMQMGGEGDRKSGAKPLLSGPTPLGTAAWSERGHG